MVDEEGKETTPEQEVVEEDKTLAVEEKLKAMEAEVEKHKAFAEEKDKGFKSLQQELSKAKGKLQHLEGSKSELSALSAKVEVLGGIVSEYLQKSGEASLDEMPPTAKIDYSQKFKEAADKAKAESEAAMAKIEIEPRQKRAEALGIPMDDDRIAFVEYLTTNGQYDKADKALDALEAELKNPEEEQEETPKMTEAEMAEQHKKEVDEAARKMLQEQGLLTTETGTPSGAGVTITQEMIDNKMGEDDFFEWWHKNEPEIEKARREGKLK